MESETGSFDSSKERQVLLPFKVSLKIAWTSIKVRFARSLLTVSTLVLAVFFLAFVNISSDVAAGLAATKNPGLLRALERSGYDIESGGRVSAKQRWIMILSLLVCTVGIVNSQLMAVTERFREIGTMKCLGALDRFVLRLFLLEAAISGLAGSVAGALAGALAALFTGLIRFGPAAILMLEKDMAALSFFSAVGVGVFLSMVGVLYPAIVAARMHPAEAMRATE